MSLSTVLFLFLTHLGVGIVFTLVARLARGGREVLPLQRRAGGDPDRRRARVPLRRVRTASPRRSAARDRRSSALVVRRGGDRPLLGDRRPGARVDPARRSSASAVRRRPGRPRRCRRSPSSAGAVARRLQVLTVASFLSSAALLGGACTAMILGHWYLVIPSLQVSHLQSIVKLHIASMVVRVAVVGAAVFVAIATWQPGLGPELPPLHHVGRTASSSGSACCSASPGRRCCRI